MYTFRFLCAAFNVSSRLVSSNRAQNANFQNSRCENTPLIGRESPPPSVSFTSMLTFPVRSPLGHFMTFCEGLIAWTKMFHNLQNQRNQSVTVCELKRTAEHFNAHLHFVSLSRSFSWLIHTPHMSVFDQSEVCDPYSNLSEMTHRFSSSCSAEQQTRLDSASCDCKRSPHIDSAF